MPDGNPRRDRFATEARDDGRGRDRFATEARDDVSLTPFNSPSSEGVIRLLFPGPYLEGSRGAVGRHGL